MRYLILQLKSEPKNARLLAELLFENLRNRQDLPQAIIAMPLHQHRYRQRGFNQCLEIARILTKKLSIPLLLNTCIRHRDTPHQMGLSAQERELNVKGAFSIIKPIKFSHIALLDDVITIGATAHELATVLKQAGVEHVEVWVCARTHFLDQSTIDSQK